MSLEVTDVTSQLGKAAQSCKAHDVGRRHFLCALVSTYKLLYLAGLPSKVTAAHDHLFRRYKCALCIHCANFEDQSPCSLDQVSLRMIVSFYHESQQGFSPSVSERRVEANATVNSFVGKTNSFIPVDSVVNLNLQWREFRVFKLVRHVESWHGMAANLIFVVQ